MEEPTPSSRSAGSWFARVTHRLRRRSSDLEPPTEEPGTPRVMLVSSRPPDDLHRLTAPRVAPPVAPPVAPAVAPPAAPRPGTTPAPAPVSASAGAGTSADNGDVTFAPKRGARHVVGVLLLASLGATALAAYTASQDPTTNTIAVAVTIGALTLVVWALRAGSSAPLLAVRSGQLEVRSSAGRFVFDLASPYTPIEVRGTPGTRGWKVVLARRGMAPFVIDSSMVDATEFMRVLRRYRPEDRP